MEQINIAAWLPQMAQRQPFQPAIIFPHGRDAQGQVSYTHYTYRQLDQASDLIARGLEAAGIRRGTRTALMVKPSLDFFALTFALFKVGAVPVLVDPGIGLPSLKACLGRAAPEAFIGIPKAHAARVVLGWAKDSVRILITVGRKLFWGGLTLEEVKALGQQHSGWTMADTKGDEIAAILFTSGSTGPPKGAVYRHENFAAQVEALRRMFKIQPGEVNLPTFPLFSLFDPALGTTTVVPDMDATRPAQVDPRKIIEAIEDFGVSMMFGSPALLNTVGRYGESHQIQLPSLKRVISAGAPVPDHVMRRFVAMLPEDGKVYSPYGATESLPVALINSDEVLGGSWDKTRTGAGVCVGQPVDEVEVQIIRISDEPIDTWDPSLIVSPGEVGEVVVKGLMVTRSYYEQPDKTALAKIADPSDPQRPRHRMGDLGYLDEQGRLWLCGRKSQRIELASGQTLFTVPTEAIFNDHADVYRSALVAAKLPGAVRPVLCVELEPGVPAARHEAIRRELLELGQRYERSRDVDTILFHPSLPVDIRHNAKIRREELGSWATQQLKK